MAWGPAKAPVIKKAVEEDDTEQVPASLLQNHIGKPPPVNEFT